MKRKNSLYSPPIARALTGLLIVIACLACTSGQTSYAETDVAGYATYTLDDNAVAHFHQGQVWMGVGQYEAAIKEFQIGIRLKPTAAMTAVLYNNLGLAFNQLGMHPKAIISFQRAIELNPSYSLFYENLVKTYTRTGALETAIVQLNTATSNNPEDARGWYLLGMVHRQQGNDYEARWAFENFIALAPRSELADAAKHYLKSLKMNQPQGVDIQ